ncbi:MAG TPA: hypothetical protein VIF15_14235 [Polyangiaceae bacterium]|jgi:hypothetical protein
MTETTPSPVRRSARVLAFVIPLLLGVGLAGACGDMRRSLGEDCLKSQDCLSGICSQLHCAVAPPTTDTVASGPGSDATVDGPVDGSGDGEGGEAGSDGSPDSADGSGNTDAPPDSSGDSGGG